MDGHNSSTQTEYVEFVQPPPMYSLSSDICPTNKPIIYVVDSGIRTTGSTFGDKVTFLYSAVQDAKVGSGDYDPGNHGMDSLFIFTLILKGTRVASIISDKLIGLYRCANLYDVRVCDGYRGCYEREVTDGLERIRRHVNKTGQIGIINMSFHTQYSHSLEKKISAVYALFLSQH